MSFFDSIKKFFAKIFAKIYASLGQGDTPAQKKTKRKDGYSVARPDVGEELMEFQSSKPSRPAAQDNELSDVLDDVLTQMPKSSDSGLYAKKHPK